MVILMNSFSVPLSEYHRVMWLCRVKETCQLYWRQASWLLIQYPLVHLCMPCYISFRLRPALVLLLNLMLLQVNVGCTSANLLFDDTWNSACLPRMISSCLRCWIFFRYHSRCIEWSIRIWVRGIFKYPAILLPCLRIGDAVQPCHLRKTRCNPAFMPYLLA